MPAPSYADHKLVRSLAAGIPAEVGFATKPQLGITMLARAHAAGVLSGWVTADEAFSQNRAFRAWLAARGVPFVLATRSDDTVSCPDGRRHQARNLPRWPTTGRGSGAWPGWEPTVSGSRPGLCSP
jgi:SRSO17 transposase